MRASCKASKSRSAFGIRSSSNEFYMTKTASHHTTSLSLSTYQLPFDGFVCEMTTGLVSITGGDNRNFFNKAHCIDTLRDFAVLKMPPMKRDRENHSAVFFDGFLYVIGGMYDGYTLSACERLSISTDYQVWEICPLCPMNLRVQLWLLLSKQSASTHLVADPMKSGDLSCMRMTTVPS
mmetsp:Transcript_32474/g.56148  ORF Transcript_32474/g.56148 Transcript_32474/m.56148 type:complete len:179 (-) Transcript_32474:658-1194(-)